ncbi:SOS response-associated peptidase family protein [Pseudomonas aeruginosa]|uniref:SOS response-associated peptidase family protein n=1 Tax=Pseudomonas aeruginosa TaxID=287 RepID=UPI0039DFA3B6
MCGRLSQYTGLHEFVDALSMPNVLVNLVGEQSERYNVAPSTAVTTLRLEGDALVAQPIRWGWRPFWARERAEQIVLNQGEPSESFTWYPVSRDVGNVRNQGPQLIEPQRSAS